MPTNDFNQEIGFPVPDFTPGQAPAISQLIGDYSIVEPLSQNHFNDAYAFYGPSSPEVQWTYFPLEAFDNKQSFSSYFESMVQSQDPYSWLSKTRQAGACWEHFLSCVSIKLTVSLKWVGSSMDQT